MLPGTLACPASPPVRPTGDGGLLQRFPLGERSEIVIGLLQRFPLGEPQVLSLRRGNPLH
jgi:hypothetical protein